MITVGGVLDGVINVLLLLAILVVLVVIHELGHFIAARRAGVRVHEFGVGFPPRAKVLHDDGETIYTLNWLPIGGFVRLEGEEGESDDPRSFVRQRLPTRLVILLAGVTMNFLLAWLIFALIAGLADPSATVRIGSVQPGSPAEQAGLRGGQQVGTVPSPDGTPIPVFDESGDRILAIDGQRFAWFELPDGPRAPIDYLRVRPSTTVTLLVEHRDGTTEEVQATTRSVADIAAGRGALGFSPQAFVPGPSIERDPLSAIAIGGRRTIDASTLILRALGEFVTNITSPQVSGPVGIVNAIGFVRTEAPPIFLLFLVGLLSANLAVINALPFPPLDGGRVAVSLIQAVSGNRISQAAERLVYLTGFILLMLLLVWITYFDIQRLGGGT
ncbi:MAG: site-2 protease family protein [Chloroflexota bacterium]|nr:site-2 protease family protein [Chloroflexota bacterium]